MTYQTSQLETSLLGKGTFSKDLKESREQVEGWGEEHSRWRKQQVQRSWGGSMLGLFGENGAQASASGVGCRGERPRRSRQRGAKGP